MHDMADFIQKAHVSTHWILSPSSTYGPDTAMSASPPPPPLLGNVHRHNHNPDYSP
jgi:hypothetical protein